MKFSRVLWLSVRRHVRRHASVALGTTLLLAAVAGFAPRQSWLFSTGIVTLGAVLLYCVYVLAAMAGLVFGAGDELRRKTSHVLACVTVIAVFVATRSPTALTAFCGIQLAWYLYSQKSARFKLLRQISVDRRDGSRSAGEMLFAPCIALTGWLAGEPSFAWLTGTLLLAMGDTAAALAGKRFGRHRYQSFGGIKSVEGSAAFLLVAMLVVFALAQGPQVLPQPAGLFTFCLALTLVEAVSGYGSDNLSIPLFSVIVLADPAAMAGPSGLLWVSAVLLAALVMRNRPGAAPRLSIHKE
jgi:phytol kinase